MLIFICFQFSDFGYVSPLGLMALRHHMALDFFSLNKTLCLQLVSGIMLVAEVVEHRIPDQFTLPCEISATSRMAFCCLVASAQEGTLHRIILQTFIPEPPIHHPWRIAAGGQSCLS